MKRNHFENDDLLPKSIIFPLGSGNIIPLHFENGIHFVYEGISPCNLSVKIIEEEKHQKKFVLYYTKNKMHESNGNVSFLPSNGGRNDIPS